jgi:hypothetical protein
MPQIHAYLPRDVVEALRRKARARGLSLSRYVAEIVQRDAAPGWPPGYFEEVVGGWQGKPLVRAPQGKLERRESL